MQKMQANHAPDALVAVQHDAYLSRIRLHLPERKTQAMNILKNYRNWRRFRSAIDELSRLSNRELDDIGITRADIPHVARRGR